MKFRITATSIWSWSDYDELIEKYPSLLNYGFEVEEKQVPVSGCWTRDENGNSIWQETDRTRSSFTPYIYVDSLEQLIELIENLEDDVRTIVLTEYEIEIYDGYRE